MKNRLLVVALLFCSIPLALAQAPNGSVSFNFDRTNSYPVWDFTGLYQFDQQMLGAGGATLPFSFQAGINHELSGRLSGSGTTILTIGSETVAANYTVSGRVSLGGNLTRVVFSIHLFGSGLDMIAGKPRNFSANLSYNLRVDPNLADMPAWIEPVRGNAVTGNVNIVGLGSSRIIADPTAPYSVALPSGVNGSWSVSINVVPLARLAGTGAVVVTGAVSADQPAGSSPNLTLNGNVQGIYRASQNLSRVVFSGSNGSRPTTLEVQFITGESQPVSVLGKVLGQTVRFTTPSD